MGSQWTVALGGGIGRIFHLDKLPPCSACFWPPVWHAQSTGTPAAAKRSNITFVLIDDADFSAFGAYGSGIATPVIDSLANGGPTMHCRRWSCPRASAALDYRRAVRQGSFV